MKLSKDLLKKLYETATSDEISLIIYLAQFQNEFGKIEGIYYKNICKDLNISESNFYTIKKSLENKNIITVDYTNKENKYWTITLCDNIFLNNDDYKKGYLKINKAFLHSNKFYNLGRPEKIVILNLLDLYRDGRKQIFISLNKIKDWTLLHISSVYRIIKNLIDSKILNITKTEYGISLNIWNCKNFFEIHKNSEIEIYAEHMITYYCNKSKVIAEDKDIKDTVKLVPQYKQLIKIEKILYHIENSIREISNLAPRYINKVLNSTLG